MAQHVKNLPAVQETKETGVQSLSQEDPLEEEMATYSSTLAWKIPWIKEPSELQSTGLQRIRHDWAHNYKTHFSKYLAFTCFWNVVKSHPHSGLEKVLDLDWFQLLASLYETG